MPEETQETLLDRLQSFFNLNNSETDPIKTNQNLELSNVALSSLPATAGPNDPWTGQEDELGNRTYKAFDGSTYTLKLSDDQRTNLTKVQEDIIPAVKEYIKEPYLPTTDQVLDTGKAVASSVYDTASIPGDLVSGKKQLSDVTMGNIYEIASGSGAMSTLGKAPPNSLRMFGGVSMLGTETSRSFKKAKKLLKNSTKVNAEDLVGGAIDFNTNKKIWEETNWYVDPSDGQWRFYIDDTYSNLDSIKDIFKNNQITQAEIQGSKFREDTGLLTRLGDIFDHKELYKKYPTFKNISVDFYDNPLEKSAGKAGGGRIGINLANHKDMGTIRSTLLHEIQHIVQRRENFLQGSSPANIPTELLDKRRAKLEAEKKPFEITRDRLVNEFNATKRLFDERLKLSKEPLNGLTADQEFEISKLKVQDATGELSGPSWTSIGKDYGVPPAQIQKAWGRQNNLNTLRKEVNKLEKEILDAIRGIDALDQESFDAEFQFYQGAGGEIESRLVGKMGETLTVPNAPTKFPIESRADMLRDEDNKVLINRPRYRGREGVDPLTYTNEPRRNPDETFRPTRQTFLDKLRGRKIKKEREKAGLGTKYNKGGSVNTEALGWTAEGKKFAEANPVNIKAPEGLSIKNVPAFARPMSAGPEDKWTGREDELGNREYRSQLDGSTYFIKPDPDQRTELEKIQQDIIPAVTKYLENPTAPSKEQTIEFLKTAAGDAWETISIPGDLVSGDKTLGDVNLGQLFEIGGSAAVASLPMSVPKGSMRTFGGSNPPTYEPRSNPFVYSEDGLSQENLDLFNKSFIMFREPIVEFAGTVDIPKKGLLGSEFLNLIKKNDSIPETSLQEGIIEPGKRYTRKELQNAVRPFRSVANIASDKPKQFEAFQRQEKHAGFLGGQEIEYFDIPIDTTIGSPAKKFKANEQHYDSDTLVHVRGSIITPENSGPWDTDFLVAIQGEGYLLVEEIQSDLLTKGFVRPKNKFDADYSNATDDYNRSAQVSYGEAFGSIDKQIKSIVKELEIDIDKYTADLIDNILQDGPIGSALITAKESTALENYMKLVQKKLTDKKIDAEIDVLDMLNIYQSYLSNKKISDTYPNPNDIGLPPIRKNKQAVDEALKILIAKAAQSGVTKIVIPPAERIALARGRKLKKDKGDRFYRTYVTDLEKSLRELQDNYPVKIYKEELPYKRHEDFVGFVPEGMADNDIIQDAMTDLLADQLGITNTLSNTSTSKIGTIIDISELVNKYKVEIPRQFAEGGSVNTMDNQMRMFEEGGIADDGMNRDPVSGNEVPSGSLAKEVRDDIPAQLSEGEYVVPADVVRYFGVRVFEEMRNEAKMGLQAMERDGRIGGEPVMSPVDQGTVSEEDLAQIEQMFTTGVANGGLMDKIAYVAANDPVINKSFNQGGAVVKFAVGGMAQSAYADPTQVDAVIGKFMQMAQEKPQIMEELAKRGIQVNRTSATEQPQQIQMSNSPAQTTEPITEGTIVPIKAAEGVLATPTMALPTGFQSNYAIPGASLTNTVPTITPAVAPVVEPAQPTSTAPLGSAGVAYDPCASAGMVLDPVTNSCVLRPESGGDKDQNDFMKSMMTDASGTSEFRFKDPETNYFELSKEDFADLAKPANQKDKNKNDFEKQALGLGVAIAGANPITALGALIYSGFQIKEQGQAISNLRAMALVAEARGFTAEAAALNIKAEEAIGTSSFGVGAANKLGVLNGVNNFFQQVAAFGSNITLDESKYKGATLERAKDAYALANGGRSSIRAAAYASNFEKQRATAQANRAKKVNEADRIAEATAAAAASSAAQVAAYQAAQNNNNNDNGGNNDYVYTPGGGGGVSSAGDNTSGSGTGQGFIDRSTASTGNATGGLIARPKKKKKK